MLDPRGYIGTGDGSTDILAFNEEKLLAEDKHWHQQEANKSWCPEGVKVLAWLWDSDAEIAKSTGRESVHRIENRPMALVIFLESITPAFVHRELNNSWGSRNSEDYAALLRPELPPVEAHI